MKRTFAVLFSLGIAAGAAAQANPTAIIHTSMGDITVELYPAKAPKTVENFIGLSTGQKAWTDPKSGKAVTDRPLYSGTIFHRVISGFMLQGGDPMGNGMGGPGYKFEDEFSDLGFEGPGLLAMANSGPRTNGSQFFITLGATPHLNNKHTIFGKVTGGMDVVTKIGATPTGQQDRPSTPVVINNIEIVGAGGAAPAANPASATTTGTVPAN